MADGYFLLRSAPVSRAKGHSAIAAAAYQSNQRLTHKGQLLCCIGVEHRKKLNKGIVTDELRQTLQDTHLFEIERDTLEGLGQGIIPHALRKRFEKEGEELSERLRISANNNGWTVQDHYNSQTYDIRQGEDGIYTVSRHNGITVSASATAERIKERNWVIRDGKDREFHIRQVNERYWDNEQKKQITTGRKWLDVYAAKTHNYNGKDDIDDSWIQAPKHAPDWIKELAAKGHHVKPEEREKLWQTAEDLENKRDGRPARRFLLAMIRDLTEEENKEAIREFIDENFTQNSIISDVAIHHKTASDGHHNNHAHILVFTREAQADGTFREKKNTWWNSKERIMDWRKSWDEILNRKLEEKGSDTRVDHRSYKDRGIDKKPGMHLGRVAAAMEERGIETDKGNYNREVTHKNAVGETMKRREPQGEPPPPAPLPRESGLRHHYQQLQDFLQGSVRRMFSRENDRQETEAQEAPEAVQEAQESNPAGAATERVEMTAWERHKALMREFISDESSGTPVPGASRQENANPILRSEAQGRFIQWAQQKALEVREAVQEEARKALSWVEREQIRKEGQQGVIDYD